MGEMLLWALGVLLRHAPGLSRIITWHLWEPMVGVVIPRPSSFVWLLTHVRLGVCDR